MSRVNEDVTEIAEELMPELEDRFFDEDLFDEEEFRNRFSVMTGEELDREASIEDCFEIGEDEEEEFDPDDFHPLTKEELMTEGSRYFEEE